MLNRIVAVQVSNLRDKAANWKQGTMIVAIQLRTKYST
jgi:hypothetical protein